MENQVNSTIAALESKIGMLEAELTHLQKILMDCGFSEGIQTLKMAAEELIKTIL